MMNLATLFAGALCRLLCALSLLAPLSSALADEFLVNSGLSAHWFNPERSGEGLVLEILGDDAALLYWFTYDEDGNQRWLIDVGEISGDEIVFPELTVTRGGRFGPDFDSDDVEYEVVGEATLSFSDCDHGEFSYSAFGQSETIPMVRLSQTMAAGCQPPQGVPGQPVREYAGQSGSWYDPSHAGEGYTLQWMSRDEALLIWFSYDPQGNQYWMLGTGTYDDGKIEFPMLHSTNGGRFGGEFDPEDVEFINWGSLTLELDCQGGNVLFDSPLSGFGAGSLELDRLTHLARPACPWVKPKLTDLYHISWNEIPNEDAQVQAWSVANDGTVAGWSTGMGLALWKPDTGEWQLEEDQEVLNISIFLSPDGSSVFATERVPGADPLNPIDPLMWRKETGWRPLQDLIFDRSVLEGVSQDFSRTVGHGSHFGDARSFPWVWDATHGQQELPLTEEITGATPIVSSNDGKTIIGNTLGPPIPGTSIPTLMGVRWKDGGDPEILRDHLGFELGVASACNHDCSLIFGFSQAGSDPEHPFFRQAWFMSDSGQFEYLGEMGMIAVTSDGTITIGDYLTPNGLSRALIWTQDTGMTTVPALIEELGIGDDQWEAMYPVDISPDGSKILLQGNVRQGMFGNSWRAVVLELELKE